MRIKFIALLMALPASAANIKSFDGIMRQPMEKRVHELNLRKEEASRYLIETAFDPGESLENRWRALVTMGRLDAIHFRDPLDRALISKDWFMRNAALIALQTDERLRAVAWSERLLEDPALVVRSQAVRNLVLLNARESEPKLWAAISDKRNYRGGDSLWIRANIAEALAGFAIPGRAKSFENLLLDSDERLHKWAILGLETSTGIRMSDRQEPAGVRRQKWLSRLGVEEI